MLVNENMSVARENFSQGWFHAHLPWGSALAVVVTCNCKLSGESSEKFPLFVLLSNDSLFDKVNK